MIPTERSCHQQYRYYDQHDCNAFAEGTHSPFQIIHFLERNLFSERLHTNIEPLVRGSAQVFAEGGMFLAQNPW